MSDVHGGLLKCVLQLAACSDKLRLTDAKLGTYVTQMQKELGPVDLPALKAKLAVIPEDHDALREHSIEHQFEELLEHGAEAAERLEVTKKRLEKELRRRSEQFKELVSTRNADIQEEYARMLKELDDQAESLTKEIEEERSNKQSQKRRRLDTAATNATADMERQNAQLKREVESYSMAISQLQDEFAVLEAEKGDTDDDMEDENQISKEEQIALEVAELKQEVELLREAHESIAAKQTTSFKAQFESELQELDEEIDHLKRATEETSTQLSSHSLRLHALLRTLAPNASIGTLMTRLHQQLTSDTAGQRKTVALQTFLESCPSAEEGKKAIDEMKKLALIYYYESSGLLALAD
ncbi:hypothetical protein Poli38472_014052 [Pythium oligandrum]|uniref:Uncharacterized protein n=1 Tax=Pythium oligandrum TaxID=41045 RepID=A0A8K1CQ92_PYTOL|nr:hypothetical protein Poli38472_014052 [Pythium oligandrum]|eukprot:TMW66740.1 hypothetical protein Poli38472_014052 [Pythium oligandrum]